MHRATATVRITIGLVALSLSVLFLATTLGLVPDDQAIRLRGRMSFCETVALSSSIFISEKATDQLESHLEAVLQRNPELERVVIQPKEGEAAVDVRQPGRASTTPSLDRSADPISFPIFRGRDDWGSIDFYFVDRYTTVIGNWIRRPVVRLPLFVAAATFTAFYFFLRRMLQYLDPTKAVPDRVRSALNTLAEGLIILDENERIVLANDAFARTLHRTDAELIGKTASQLGWVSAADSPLVELPWVGSLKRGVEQNDIPLSIQVAGEEARIFRVNSTPVLDSNGNGRGALATFNDITAIEKSRAALRKMLEELYVSRDEIKRQNHELQILATRDPLTGCFNRRSFFEQFESQWIAAERGQFGVSCVMVDVDHFKSINDGFGHAMGDKVLQHVGAVMRVTAREKDFVCRYGGEEFAVLMPHTALDEAAELAETIRLAIAAIELPDIRITASVGVAERCESTTDPHSLLNEADKCLYFAKRNGRNRVVRRDRLPKEFEVEDTKNGAARAKAQSERASIPFHAVTALFSALAYRDHETAEHSRRVADLVVTVAHGLMPSTDVYILEIAALLHDIGKIGVPDAILLKQTPLTKEEWQVMSRHQRIGVEIIHSAFCCDKLSELVQCHHAWFVGGFPHGELPSGQNIPLGARLLQIADAYDAMVSDRVYRKARTQAQAFEELRRCAGTQFDPDLVERLIALLPQQETQRSRNIGPVNKQFALQIGMEIERLADTLDGRDLHGLETLASRLKETATRNGVTPIAEIAQRLEVSAKSDARLDEVVTLTQELLCLCRSTQRAFLSPAEA